MVRRGQRTGIFDLDDTATIVLDDKIENVVEEVEVPKIKLSINQLDRTNARLDIDMCFHIVSEQMRLSGIRSRTIQEYAYTFKRLVNTMDIHYLDELKLDVVYEFLSTMGNTSNVTKQSKVRVLKAIFNRFYDNGWIKRKWWKDLKIKVDKQIKPPANKNNLAILLSLLDMSNFIQFRDAVAILTIYKCGLRMSTLMQLEEKHIDFENKLLLLTGDIMKNHDVLKLPFDDELEGYFKRLIKQNDIIRKHYKKRNKFIFISKFGESLDVATSPCAITKRLSYYARKYQLTDINAHAIRRLYATELRKKGADVVLISKALHHKSLTTTTQYLGISSDEVARELRDYL